MSAVASTATGIIGASAAERGAKAQAGAAREAAQLAQDRYMQTRSDLMPYNAAGQANLPAYSDFYKQTASNLTTAYNNAQANIPAIPSNDTLANMPGYAFTLGQGLKSTQNSAAARGLGVSGAALQGAGTYATGLANSNWQSYWNAAQQRYQDYSNQFSNAYNGSNAVFNQLSNSVNLGENAGAQTGYIGSGLAQTAGSALQAAGVATSAGYTGAATAINSAINNAGNAGINYLGIKNALNSTKTDATQGQLAAYNPRINGDG